MCCVLLAVCISNALLFQTLCTPADETPETSSPTGNKKDIKRMRTGPKMYVSYAIHLLEKTQTEEFLDFQRKHPNV